MKTSPAAGTLRALLLAAAAGTWLAAGTAVAADCEERCEMRYERCYDRCEDYDGRRWERCADQCDDDGAACGMECSSRSATGTRALTGEDGCYFGECSSQSSEPTGQAPVQQPSPQPQTWPQTAPQQTMPQQPAVASFCVTSYGSCPMMMAIPVGSVCSCYTWMGEIPGVAQ